MRLKTLGNRGTNMLVYRAGEIVRRFSLVIIALFFTGALFLTTSVETTAAPDSGGGTVAPSPILDVQGLISPDNKLEGIAVLFLRSTRERGILELGVVIVTPMDDTWHNIHFRDTVSEILWKNTLPTEQQDGHLYPQVGAIWLNCHEFPGAVQMLNPRNLPPSCRL